MKTDKGPQDHYFTAKEIKDSINMIWRLVSSDVEATAREIHAAFNALDRQYPLPVLCEHKDGEEYALTACPTCGCQMIINYALHKKHYQEWYCKKCSQRLVLPEMF